MHCSGNDGPVSDGVFKFEEYLNAEDEIPPAKDATSSSILLPSLETLHLRKHSAWAERRGTADELLQHYGRGLRTRPRMLSPPSSPLSPHITPQTLVHEPSWQANDNMEPVDVVAWRQRFLIPSASGTLTLMSEKTYSDGKSFSKSVDCFWESPRNALLASEYILAIVLRDMPDEVTWSEEESRFFARHKEGLGIRQEECSGLPASYRFPNTSGLPNSSLRRMPAGGHDSTVRPANISGVEVENGIVKQQRLSRSYYSHGSSGYPYFMDVAAVEVPYEPNAHTVEHVNYHLKRSEEGVKLVFGQDQNVQFANYSPGESRSVCDMQPRIMLQDHLKRRCEMASENSERPRSALG